MQAWWHISSDPSGQSVEPSHTSLFCKTKHTLALSPKKMIQIPQKEISLHLVYISPPDQLVYFTFVCVRAKIPLPRINRNSRTYRNASSPVSTFNSISQTGKLVAECLIRAVWAVPLSIAKEMVRHATVVAVALPTKAFWTGKIVILAICMNKTQKNASE